MKLKPVLLLITLLFGGLVHAQEAPVERTTQYFETIKDNPALLKAFLYNFPKGGDLHNHLSGATFAENLIRYARNDHLCMNKNSYTAFVNPRCQTDDLLENAVLDTSFYEQLVDQWSMRHFNPAISHQTGHDHFFATFGKFGAITHAHRANVLAEVVQRAADQHELYLELMDTLDGKEAATLGKQIGWQNDFAGMRNKLLAANFAQIVADARKNLDTDEAGMRAILACQTNQPQTGCMMTVRYQYQVLREQAPEAVFAQLLLGFEVASQDPRVVGLNMVQPEDGTLSMRDYKLHMQFIHYLRQFYPTVQVSLHAGELSTALVPAEGLSFHINDAVNVAHANRIGHGVDIMQETNADTLLRTMAAKQVMVEVNLSSNDQILNVTGMNHPLQTYMQYGVPVALSTDDEGVTRSNLTHEYTRAVKTYHFTYSMLKNISRNSLHYAFLQGASLWLDNQYKQPNAACAKAQIGAVMNMQCAEFLKANPKAALEWKLETKFIEFENNY